MKTLFTVLAMVALSACVAQAGVDYTDTFEFNIDTGYVTNVSAAAVPFAGISFADAGANMDPALYTGFAAHVGGAVPEEDMMWVMSTFGVGGLSIAELGKSAADVSEGTAGADAMWPAGVSMNFGQFAAACSVQDLQGGFVVVVNEGGNYVSGEGLVVPEPATMSLLGLGALGFIRRRR